jgi:hypothetical protein
MNCRLCGTVNSENVHRDQFRGYFRCASCGLIFVPSEEHVTRDEEKKRYDLHDNNSGHEGYVRFLKEIVSLVKERRSASDRILDYGSGRDAVLTRLLTQEGFYCAAYDPLYGIGGGALVQEYDVIILCEVIEHLRDLGKELSLIKNALSARGTVIVRTQPYPPLEKFPAWWYKNDSTHINFFSPDTITIVAEKIGRKRVERSSGDIFILSR